MNICNFNTAPPAPDSIYTLNFVFETEEKNMSRICTDTAHRIYLVTDGSGILNTAYGNFYVKSGDIFSPLPPMSTVFQLSENYGICILAFWV